MYLFKRKYARPLTSRCMYFYIRSYSENVKYYVLSCIASDKWMMRAVHMPLLRGGRIGHIHHASLQGKKMLACLYFTEQISHEKWKRVEHMVEIKAQELKWRDVYEKTQKPNQLSLEVDHMIEPWKMKMQCAGGIRGWGSKVPKSLVTSLDIIYEYRAFIKPSWMGTHTKNSLWVRRMGAVEVRGRRTT